MSTKQARAQRTSRAQLHPVLSSEHGHAGGKHRLPPHPVFARGISHPLYAGCTHQHRSSHKYRACRCFLRLWNAMPRKDRRGNSAVYRQTLRHILDAAAGIGTEHTGAAWLQPAAPVDYGFMPTIDRLFQSDFEVLSVRQLDAPQELKQQYMIVRGMDRWGTRVSKAPGDDFDPEVETYAFHCTTGDRLHSILTSGLDTRYSHRGWFGPGIYVGLSPEVANRYARRRDGEPDGGIRFMLVLRVLPGTCLAMPEGEGLPLPSTTNIRYDSVVGTKNPGWKEMAVYANERVLVVGIVTYRCRT